MKYENLLTVTVKKDGKTIKEVEAPAAVIVTPLNIGILLNGCDGVDLLIIIAQLNIAIDDLKSVLIKKCSLSEPLMEEMIQEARHELMSFAESDEV